MSFNDAINSNQKKRIEKLRQRQKVFLSNIRSTTSYHLIDIDTDFNSDLPTLRQMIMSITANGKPNTPLFHNVDLDYQGMGHVFQYSNDVAAEAECAINTLLPYLMYLFPELDGYEDEYFYDEAIARCEGLIFDPVKGMVIESGDGDNAGIELEIDDDLDGFNFLATNDDEVQEVTDDIQVRPTNHKKTTGPSDDDSISTFGGSLKTSAKASAKTNVVSPARPTQASVGNNNFDDVSVMSSGTMKTIQTLREDTEKRFNQISNDSQQLHSKLDKLMELLGQQGSIGNSGTEAISPSSDDAKAGSGSPSTSGGEM